jgi:hypothetical protein
MKNSRIVYYDSFSVAVINTKGQIRRVYCPFIVKCMKTVDDIQENSVVYVDQVFKDPEELLTYLIGGNLYPYSNFRVTVKF